MLTEEDKRAATVLRNTSVWDGYRTMNAQEILPKLLDEIERLNEVIESTVALAVLGDLETIKQIKVQHG